MFSLQFIYKISLRNNVSFLLLVGEEKRKDGLLDYYGLK